MATTIRAVFDDEVLRPEEPLPLRADTTYVITVNGEAPTETEAEPEEEYVLTKLGHLAIDMGIEDFSARHDWYVHGRLPDDEP